jgi:pyruvate,water dikinase
MIGVHPRALPDFQSLDGNLPSSIRRHIGPDEYPVDLLVSRLSEGVATIACAFAPAAVIVRFSDFKSNEYRHLIGGD